MQYISTRDKNTTYLASQAIAQGLAPDGGLMTPAYLPKPRASPCLELWHGPTCAFKDMALQMLPHLLSASLVKTEEEKTVCILVATSGDTGKAAWRASGMWTAPASWCSTPRTACPPSRSCRWSPRRGNNVGVCAVVGNFDDAQTGVKRLFSDEACGRAGRAGAFPLLRQLHQLGPGAAPDRLLYLRLLRPAAGREDPAMGRPVNVCVPTGNFGNILAAYYAREMGVPIDRLICASNSNNVLTDFIRTGGYDRNRAFHNTMSPSMDILISSNLERLLLALTQDDERGEGLHGAAVRHRDLSGQRPGEGEAAEAVRWLFLRRRGDQGRDRPHLSEVRLPHRPPHRRGLRRPGAVPERDGGTRPPASWSPPPVPSSSATASSAPWARRRSRTGWSCWTS